MEVQEFVTSILQQLQAGLEDAQKKTNNQKEFTFDKSIKFDLAVTHSSNKEGDVGGKAKVGIKIVDFELGGSGKMTAAHEVVQRIQFSVNVWNRSDESGVVSSPSTVHTPFFSPTDSY